MEESWVQLHMCILHIIVCTIYTCTFKVSRYVGIYTHIYIHFTRWFLLCCATLIHYWAKHWRNPLSRLLLTYGSEVIVAACTVHFSANMQTSSTQLRQLNNLLDYLSIVLLHMFILSMYMHVHIYVSSHSLLPPLSLQLYLPPSLSSTTSISLLLLLPPLSQCLSAILHGCISECIGSVWQ